jgi:DNA-binding GntR family transcriptional regulator
MIHTALQDAIITHVLPPGQRLMEERLAQIFEVSRTPVREAVLRLEAEHFVQRIPRRGPIVSPITTKDIVDVYVVREATDGLAAYIAAQEATPADLSKVEWLNAQFTAQAGMGGEANMGELVRLNLMFHETLAEISKNALLMSVSKQIHNLTRRFGSTTFLKPGRAVTAASEHQQLIEALRVGDGELARDIAVHHMRVARQIRIEMLEHEQASQE